MTHASRLADLSRLRDQVNPAVAEPARVGATTGAIVCILAGCSIASRSRLASAVLGGAAAGFATGLSLRQIAENHRLATQEARDLWGLSGIVSDGKVWPAPGGWALSAAAIALIVAEMQARRLKTVVELGPGTSSVAIGRTLPSASMYGLEHDAAYVTAVEHRLAEHGLTDYGLVHAPLRRRDHQGKAVDWYSEAALAKLPNAIDVLIVDGPPNWNGGGNRSPAWEMLRDRMSQGGIVVVDDTQRRDERQMVSDWVSGGGLRVFRDAGSFIALEVVAEP